MKETHLSTLMEDDIKRWTAKREVVLVMEIIQGKTTVAEVSRSFDLPASEIEEWVGDVSKLRIKPQQYERQHVYGEAMLELRTRKKRVSLLGNEDEK